MLFAAAVILSYMLLLVILAVAAPGTGVGGSLIELVPGSWRDWAHVPAYGLLGWMVMWGFRRRGWPVIHAASVGILVTAVFGLWTEVMQGTAPGREASLHDIWNDLLGGMIAAAVLLWQQSDLNLSKRSVRAQGMNLHHRTKGTGSK